MLGSGRSSSDPPTLPWDPPTSREAIRLTMLYATDLRHALDTNDQHRPAGEVLRLARLANFYAHSANQLPHILAHTDLDPADLGFRRWNGNEVESASFWVIVLPSQQVLMALSLDVRAGLIATIPLLTRNSQVATEFTNANAPTRCRSRNSSFSVAQFSNCAKPKGTAKKG